MLIKLIRSGWLLLLAAALLLLPAWKNGTPRPVPGQHSFAWLQQQFGQPDKEFGSAPLWVWNTKVTRAIIDSMMTEFKSHGFGGVFVHPRPGLVTEYLSDDWFDLWKHAADKGKQLGLDVWIYDEDSYPSGFAGGHVPAAMPSSYNQGQMLHLVKTVQLPDTAERFFICLKEEQGRFINITGKLAAEKGKTGNYYLFNKAYYHTSPWYGGYSYVDLMAPGVTEKFIEVTMSGYEKSVGKEFGKTVPGIFSDEPNIEVQGGGNIRWTPDLFAHFRQTWGYDLAPHLPELFEETGDWKKTRHNYFQTLLQLFIDRWSKPMYAYTEKKGLEWTGHYWEHGWPSPNCGPDNMAMYAWHQRPAIDMLFNQFNEQSPNAQFGNIRSVKELASVANQLGKKRTLCETYGGGGWELTLMDMKRLGDWQYALGINTLNQHLATMTLTGARKYDYPQSFSYQNPVWPYYTPQNQYFARLSLALSRGQQQNDILILEPTSSAWMYFNYDKSNPRINEIGNSFQAFITRLEKAQVEYDLGSENIIRDHGRTAQDQFIVGERAYHTVIIPPGMENLDSATFQLLQKYTAAGGKILLYENLRYINGAPATALNNWLQQTSLTPMPVPDQQAIQQYLPDPAISFPELDTTQGDLYHHRRVLDDGQLLFLSNASMHEHAGGQVRIKGKDALLMDLRTGQIVDYPETDNNGYITMQYDLPPAGSMLLFAADKPMHISKSYTPPQTGQPVKGSPVSIKRLSPNVLTVDFCDLRVGDSSYNDIHVLKAADITFKHFGFRNGNPWNTSVQFKQQTIERDTFSRNTKVSARYHFTINGADTKNMQAVVERPEIWQVTLNGQALRPLKGRWWLDKGFAVYDISQRAKSGDNVLEITAAPMRVLAEIEPVYILGDFSLASADKGFEIQKEAPLSLGSWRTMGMPLYGHSVAYTKQVRASTRNSYQVKLNDWKGTAAAVKVNGKEAGIIDIPPYTLNISSYMREGDNTVEVMISGSLKNTLGPHHNQPRPGLVSPWHFLNVKRHPAGNAYDTYDYGMMSDFDVEQLAGK
ncbi:glycosyl hydrolase [Chitinophaga sp. 22321]|uniref:Alpha-L-rhamnosidase n=1 Tax=Chitinophaga hostae TaxID=2831022 RepID=A0ABS5J929_9BACT|nr:glycosyl hydrolase [Chitinophaga hostae]MBS0031585.1 hypothetical protein [Chitinophaga hostae]